MPHQRKRKEKEVRDWGYGRSGSKDGKDQNIPEAESSAKEHGGAGAAEETAEEQAASAEESSESPEEESEAAPPEGEDPKTWAEKRAAKNRRSWTKRPRATRNRLSSLKIR